MGYGMALHYVLIFEVFIPTCTKDSGGKETCKDDLSVEAALQLYSTGMHA